jgi:hypothetical protein
LFLLQHCLPFLPNILIFNIKHTLSTSTTSTTSSNPPAVTNNGGYKKNNCLRAMQGGGPSATGFCSDFFGTGILPTPTAINKACSALPAKVSSACSCAVPSSGGGVKKKVVKITHFEEGNKEIIEYRG